MEGFATSKRCGTTSRARRASTVISKPESSETGTPLDAGIGQHTEVLVAGISRIRKHKIPSSVEQYNRKQKEGAGCAVRDDNPFRGDRYAVSSLVVLGYLFAEYGESQTFRVERAVLLYCMDSSPLYCLGCLKVRLAYLHVDNDLTSPFHLARLLEQFHDIERLYSVCPCCELYRFAPTHRPQAVSITSFEESHEITNAVTGQ